MLATSALGGTKAPLYKGRRGLLRGDRFILRRKARVVALFFLQTARGALVVPKKRNKDLHVSHLSVEITTSSLPGSL